MEKMSAQKKKDINTESALFLDRARTLQQRSRAMRAEVEAWGGRMRKRFAEIKRLEMIHTGIDAQMAAKKPFFRRPRA